jgi:RpiB/LacA/LacB family sugar-phosphate isomerase
MRPILIASDHAGFVLKEKIKAYMKENGFAVKDLGAYSKERCDYPGFAASLAKEISKRHNDRGVLVCKSGIGNSIVANRFPGVRAALAYNIKAARLSREHNDSNVLVMGSAFVKPVLAKRMFKIWMNTEFQGGRHTKRLNSIKKIEKDIKKWKA